MSMGGISAAEITILQLMAVDHSLSKVSAAEWKKVCHSW